MQGDEVQPHTAFASEEVGAMGTVLQKAPTEWGPRRLVKGVTGTTQLQLGTCIVQTLGAGIVVVKKAWRGRRVPTVLGELPYPQPHPRDPAGPQQASFTLLCHGHIVKVMVVRLIPRLEVPLGDLCQAIPACRMASTLRTSEGQTH